MDAAPQRRFEPPVPGRRSLLAIGAATLLLVLAFAGSAGADSPVTAYGRHLEDVEVRLRFAIELGPAELNQDIAFSERLCEAAQSAEAAAETPAARVDWLGLSQTVRRDDLGLTRTIEATLHGAYRRVGELGTTFGRRWREEPARERRLSDGVGEVRAGVLRLLGALDGFKTGFGRFLRRDCEGAETAITVATRPIGRGLLRIDSGMGLLWLLDEPTGLGT